MIRISFEIGEDDRQLILLALATLSLRNPGFDFVLNEIAMRIDTDDAGRAKLYDDFRRLYADLTPRRLGFCDDV